MKFIFVHMKKIAVLLFAIALSATIASNFGLINIWQALALNITCIVIMMILSIYMMYKLRKMTGGISILPDAKVIIPKAHVDNKFILANSDVFTKNIVPTNPLRRCIFRISMEINASIEQLGISAIRLRESGIIENTIRKNMTAKEAYIIDTVVLPNESINFKFDKDIDIKKMFIDELYAP